jgi:inosine-uridine nucleoside N-ribohydrolase
MRMFLIDTNTTSDDAVAILMALAAPDVKVAALTVVAGNVSMAQGARNALYTCEVAGVDVPVHPGAEAPLTRDPIWQGNAGGREMSESGPELTTCATQQCRQQSDVHRPSDQCIRHGSRAGERGRSGRCCVGSGDAPVSGQPPARS